MIRCAIERPRKENPVFERFLIVALLAAPACALAADDKPKTSQERKTACSKEASEQELKGDERRKFMSECVAAANACQQEKKAACTRDAADKGLKGDERRKFMSQCTKGSVKS